MDNFFSKSEFNNSGENFFSQSAPKENNSLEAQYNDLKNNYEKIFINAAESIRKEINEFKPKDACNNCKLKKECKIEKIDIFSPFPVHCEYREWQLKTISFLTSDYKQKLKTVHKNILDKKNNYECNKCAACCKLATSEYSYQQLKQRANKGDKFSQDFVSVFVPYETEEQAKQANPDFFELLNREVKNSKVYYYYCPKLNDNLCSDYENRPGICKDFPHNPLKLLPVSCAFNAWKNEVAYQAMLLKAKVDIIEFYKSKLG